ncbi:uncharacterized protein LOC122983005 isoform X1 [Thunnus albacares]|uniref:uncharacterized protein LOC122983005 isoform X1 n=1 Tax=Thunnus albacares TaxID=8236 RepID=UPI001CF6C4D1|nr:uncharacterized protein LOC122983005 isoform X1 [Thunnus albacares]XP_044208616.1 uncharacterized protein LOC122983005 isoform X1 [Thunnus albacares]
MEQSFADLLSDAFAETSVPSFPDGDLDFENLNFDEKFDEDKIGISHENLPTKEVRALHQEATGDTVLSSKATLDICMAENVDEELSDAKEDFQGAGVMSVDKTPEEEYTSSDGESEEEGSVSGGDEDDEEEDKGTGERPGDLLMSVHCGDEFHDGNKEDRIFAEGQPLAPESTENPQVRNEEQGESDEEVSYFESVPGRGSEVIIKGDEIEEDEQEGEEKKQDSSDSECEVMKIEQEQHFLAQCFEQEVENPYRDEPAKATLEFPDLSVENLQDLIAEVDTEENVEKMKDFSGEEHQEAGESFADYPSDFSSCEYVEDGDKNQENYQLNASSCASGLSSNAKQSTGLERAVTDVTWTEKAEDTDEEGDGYLYSRDLEMDADRFRGQGEASGEKIEYVERVIGDAAVTGCDDGSETSESDSYSSSDDEVRVRRSDEEFSYNMSLQDPENNKQLEDTRLYSGSSAEFSRWSVSEDHHVRHYYDRPDSAAFNVSWDLNVLTADSPLFQDLLTKEDTDGAEILSSDLTQCPAEDVNNYSAVQREGATTTSPSNQGSLDDSFFFNTELEASGISELGQLGDDEYEDDRNWEQEQERIKAFYRFYDDSNGENGREGRQIKVQFCTDPLSEVIHYETESSDRDSLSSSTEGEEDLNSAETTEHQSMAYMRGGTGEGDPRCTPPTNGPAALSLPTQELREPDNTPQVEPACDPSNFQLPESAPDLSNTQICTRKHKCLNMLKLTLKMGLVILMGLLMFWLATDQADWLSQVDFFEG